MPPWAPFALLFLAYVLIRDVARTAADIAPSGNDALDALDEGRQVSGLEPIGQDSAVARRLAQSGADAVAEALLANPPELRHELELTDRDAVVIDCDGRRYGWIGEVPPQDVVDSLAAQAGCSPASSNVS